jgi:hypothetical protein
MEPGLDTVRDRIAPTCTEPGTAHTWFLWGDSYAQALSAGITALLPRDTRLAQVATSHCRPSRIPIDLDVPGGRCERANQYALAKIAELKPDILILAQQGGHLDTDWNALAAHVRTLGVKRVVLVGPVPMWLPSLPEVVTSQYWGRDFSRVSYGLSADRTSEDARLAAKYTGSTELSYVPVIPQLCDAAKPRYPAPVPQNWSPSMPVTSRRSPRPISSAVSWVPSYSDGEVATSTSRMGRCIGSNAVKSVRCPVCRLAHASDRWKTTT